jgi:phosphoribosylformylglycinamidine synthase I
MRIAIVQFPGSNCERETILAVKRANMEPVEFLWNQSLEKLADFDGYIIVGGFSYEDRSRAGAIAALDPIMRVIKQQSEVGKPILGICNGAQILVEAGLVPGLESHKIGMALTGNKRISQGEVLGTGFYNAWIHMRLADDYQRNAFTRYLSPSDVLHVPVAHGEGRFVIPVGLLAEMQEQGLNIFQYSNSEGRIIDEFPINPNGSVNNIAAVSNKAGNVMAMMPHPERTPDGDAIFRSMRDYIEEGQVECVTPLHYSPRAIEITPYKLAATAHELIIELNITDNQAMSVENALHQLHIPATIKRQEHWEIACDSPAVLDKIKNSGVLYNDRKETLVEKPAKTTGIFLVRSKEDVVGQAKKQMLENHFGISGIRMLRHSVLWHIRKNTQDHNLTDQIIHSGILFNPYAQDCYYY